MYTSILYYCVCMLYIIYYIIYPATHPMVQKPKVNHPITPGSSNQVRFSGVITNQFIDALINVYTTILYYYIYLGEYN